MNKKGQIYLVSAIIIVGIVFALFTSANYLRQEESSNIEELSRQLSVEKEKILDYIAFGGGSEEVIINLTRSFNLYSPENVEGCFVFGDSEEVYFYQMLQGNIKKTALNVSSGVAIVNLEDSEYEFEILEGKNLYYILIEESNEERRIVVG